MSRMKSINQSATNMFKVLLTGGGTAGHVMPNIALIQDLKLKKFSLFYVGSKQGIERELIGKMDISYHAITVGKLRRYLSWLNLLMPFQLILGVIQSWMICHRIKPNVVFSKGGFVALPVVIAAWLLNIPIVVHESDLIPGLANRLSFPLARLICVNFESIDSGYPYKTVVTGLPIRKTLLQGQANKGRHFLKFTQEKPILLVWGGSLGATALNQSIWRLLPKLLLEFQILHVCGRNKINLEIKKKDGYQIFEFLDISQLSHVLACVDIVISRAGATAIYELLALQKPNILCPLSVKASRGEQIQNAQYLESLGLSEVIYPHAFDDKTLMFKLTQCYKRLAYFKQNLKQVSLKDGTQHIYETLLKFQT